MVRILMSKFQSSFTPIRLVFSPFLCLKRRSTIKTGKYLPFQAIVELQNEIHSFDYQQMPLQCMKNVVEKKVRASRGPSNSAIIITLGNANWYATL